MATVKKTNTKKAAKARPVNYKEAEALVNKYYALKTPLFKICNSDKYTETAKKVARKAWQSLEKWRKDNLDLARMTNYAHD
jgi:hypothetical protein